MTVTMTAGKAAPPPQALARVIAVANQKGGVGKTTTTFNLGVALARLGHRVLLVDMDPQAALTASTGVPVAHLEASIYDLLLDPKLDPDSVLQHTRSGVDLLPANIDLSAAEIELVNMTLRELILRDILTPLRERYGYILIDCPPSLGLLTINALAAADEVLIPLQCEYLATRGLALLLRTLSRVQERLNPGLRITGILPTMYDARTLHAREVLAELQDNFPGQVFDITIKDSVRLKESPAAGLSVVDYDPSHDAAQSYMKLAKEIADA